MILQGPFETGVFLFQLSEVSFLPTFDSESDESVTPSLLAPEKMMAQSGL